MTSMRNATLVCLLALLSGCEPKTLPATQVLVELSTDFGPELAIVETAVFDAREQRANDLQSYQVPGDVKLPFSFAIVPADDRPPASALLVVTGRDAQGAFLAQAKAIVRFREHKSVSIPLVLRAACIGKMCGALSSCGGLAGAPPICTALTELEPLSPADAGELELDGALASDGGVALDAGRVDSPSQGDARDAGARDAHSATDAGPVDAAPSPFPRTKEPATITTQGLYGVASYSQGLENPLFVDPIVYYPTNAQPPFAAVVVAPDYSDGPKYDAAWGTFFAAHGFVAFVVADISSNTREIREARLEAQLSALRVENDRPGSPLEKKIDTSRVGIYGMHSGGGYALRIGNKPAGMQLRAIASLAPWVNDNPDAGTLQLTNIKAATVIFCGTKDVVFDPVRQARPSYESLSVAKAYIELADITFESRPAPSETSATRIIVAWFKLYLESDPRYETYLSGAKLEEVRSQLSIITTANR